MYETYTTRSISRTRTRYRETFEKREKEKKTEQQQRTMENQQEPQPLVVVADNRPLREYAVPSIAGLGSSVIRPNIQANNFEIKLIILQMI